MSHFFLLLPPRRFRLFLSQLFAANSLAQFARATFSRVRSGFRPHVPEMNFLLELIYPTKSFRLSVHQLIFINVFCRKILHRRFLTKSF